VSGVRSIIGDEVSYVAQQEEGRRDAALVGMYLPCFFVKREFNLR